MNMPEYVHKRKTKAGALELIGSKTAQDRFQGAKLLVELGQHACRSPGACERLVKKLDKAVEEEREPDVRIWLRRARDEIAAKPAA